MKRKLATLSLILAVVLFSVQGFFGFKTAEASDKTGLPEGISANVEILNSWSNGNSKSYQMQVTINNNTQKNINDWSFSVALPKGSSLSGSWNGEGNITDDTLKVIPAHYNKIIYAGSNVTYGCIFNSAGKYVKSTQIITIDGKEYTINDTAPTNTPADNTQSVKLPSSYDVSLAIVNSWVSGNTNFYQFQLKLSNNSKTDVEEWSAKLVMPEKTELNSSWCGQFSMDETVLYIEPMSYNSTIKAGSAVENVGFIIGTPADYQKNSIILTIDGTNYYINSDKLPDNTENPSVTEEPKITKTPEASKAPETTKTPKPTKTPETTKIPEATKTPQATNTPKPTKTPEATKPAAPSSDESPVAVHGQLSLSGTDIVDEHGEKFQLRGISTHGIAWFPDYVNKDAFKDWKEYGANVIRLAMYSDPNAGYNTSLHSLVDDGVEYATELGMYVIIDWHILGDGNPNTYKNQAIKFFKEMSKKYADYNNVIYEICNEPNGVSWSDIKPYAEELIDVIRANDDDAIIIVGTPTWSQDVDIVSKDPIKNETNIVYALHFYAATHTDFLRDKAKTAIDNGLPLFVSEFGCCDASGNGGNNFNQADTWIKFLTDNNISFVCWNLSNKNETSALISSGCQKKNGWNYNDLSESGKWLADTLTLYTK